MAVESRSASKQSVSRKKEKITNPQKNESKSEENVNPSSPAKRNKCPGIRLVGGRIYDSVNGKTCHQCRQKTRDFTAACKNEGNKKPCPIMYCHKCLLNRYGENAEEVAALGDWSCPKCRGICNCSICMKKRGHQPTGQLTNTAKATGFSSVSEMLLKGVTEDIVVSPKKEVVLSPKKRGKENSFDGKVDGNLPNHVKKRPKKVEAAHEGSIDINNSLKLISQSPDKRKSKQEGLEKKPKKTKRDKSDEIKNRKNNEETLQEKSMHDARKPKKARKEKLEEIGDSKKKNEAKLARRTSPRKKISNKMPGQEEKLNTRFDSEENMNRVTFTKRDVLESSENHKRKDLSSNNANQKNVFEHQNTSFPVDVPLPLGREVNGVAGIDVRSEDMGNAVQFLEFCAVFGQILEVKNGQPECILRDLLQGRTARRGKISASVQFHIHLLSILQEEQGEEYETLSPSCGDNSFSDVLKKCLSESESILKAQGLVSLEKAADYGTLDASEKLRLLNILCDEILGTDKVRNWIDDQNTKLAEKVKHAKQDVLAAKQKKKSLKQKMRDDIAKAIIAAHGSLTISEHDSIVSRIKHEAEQAHSMVLESQGIILKNNRNCDAVRIEPILVRGGHAYWKLNYSDKSDVLCQNVGNADSLSLDEKWFAIDDEGKEVIEKRICSLRGKKL